LSVTLDETSIWIGVFASSRKAKNLRANSEAALHWPDDRTRLIFIRARARFVDDPAEKRKIWDRQILPYDLTDYYKSPDDPELALIQLIPYRGLLHRGDYEVAPEVWSSAPDQGGSQAP
jgi:general stress protein 26